MTSATDAPSASVRAAAASEPAAEAGTSGPHLVVLEAREPVSGPTVRLFLGTEAAQYRAERIFLWSIAQVRDPSRRYEIHLMRDLPGFHRLGWTTGFTNHRFAVPHYAGACGKAIYNDVDQIYLRDPAELFDLDLDGHGYLAIAERETSVMLLDCARMAEVWTLEDAQHRHKRTLINQALAVPGLFGPLHPGWNCRDEDEYDPAEARCYHFTTLHTQPWRPFPERFVYHEHPHRSLWWDLRRSADAHGYHVFDARRPSAAYPPPAEAVARSVLQRHADRLASLLERAAPASLQAFSPGAVDTGPDAPRTGAAAFSRRAPGDLGRLAAGEPAVESDVVVCRAGLDALSDDDVPWVIAELFRRARRAVFLVASGRAVRRRAPWRSPAGGVRAPQWWLDQLEIASAARPDVHWELVLDPEDGDGAREVHDGGAWLGAEAPRVWLISDPASPARADGLALARALGWPWEDKPLAFDAVQRALQQTVGAGAWSAVVGASPSGWAHGPVDASSAPDLVIAAGSRTAPAARWLARCSEGRSRVVVIDAEGASPADDFDCVATPAMLGALAHPRRVELAGPLAASIAPESARPADLGPGWIGEWPAHLRAPVTWLLADADLEPAALRRWVDEAARGASSEGGVLVVSRPAGAARPRTAETAGAVAGPGWPPAAESVPSLAATLSRADRLVVASRDPSLLAAAAASGRPLVLPELPRRAAASGGWRRRLVERAFARPENDRGTARPQMGVERWLSQWIARGVLLPQPEADRIRTHLVASGRARASLPATSGAGAAPRSELAGLVERVGALLGCPPGSGGAPLRRRPNPTAAPPPALVGPEAIMENPAT